jgi:hypothetical protein
LVELTEDDEAEEDGEHGLAQPLDEHRGVRVVGHEKSDGNQDQAREDQRHQRQQNCEAGNATRRDARTG